MLLVERGLFPTRNKAQAAIMAGKVVVEGHPHPKAGLEIHTNTVIRLEPDACPFVSRGGMKLAAALKDFSVSPQNRTALDLGSSTGGFTDCLLKNGAVKVYAVDVGTKQLDQKLRNDSRVVVMENTHARDLAPGMFDPLPDLCTADVSFISLSKVLPNVLPCMNKPSDFILLIKPQFELEPKKVPKGIVRVEEYRKEAVDRIRQAIGLLGLAEKGLMESPIKGSRGNIEYLLYARSV
jgi:23S rRNA (cytidine1920-2'-O)/16S rRNA (cytidine1409-2'-O)-methyltransferase